MTDSREIAEWWSAHPMTYGDTHGDTEYAEGHYEPGSREFFDRVDREFFAWNQPLHDDRPFGRIFPYDRYRTGRILEVGCGMGTMAMCWARAGATVTAVDLNSGAVAETRRRFELEGLESSACEADGRSLPFDDASFDYVYSWGVLHHSPDLDRSLSELLRVLRPGGEFGVMLYNRRSFMYWYLIEYVEGVLHAERWNLDRVQLASRYGDAGREEGNPYTWPVTPGELRKILEPRCAELDVRVLGTDLDYVLAVMAPGIGSFLPRALKKPLARRWGWSLWATGRR
jgi:SAM-dependent methyltransferase